MCNWKKVLIVVLLVTIGVGFEYGMNPTPVDASSKIEYSVIQKPTNEPKDKPIKVNVSGGGSFCYGPTFSGGESYIVIEQCWQTHVANARYDVFQRISYYINDTWLCVTAPEKVIRGDETWNYVNLRPCTINDPLQRWIIKDNAFWTADGLYRLKDTNWYGYISRNSGDKYNHTLDSSMDDWIKTVATPGNISIKTSIAWDLNNRWGNERYFIRWGGSDKNTTPLYYNPESGHLAQYDRVSGSLYCMYSNVGKSNWNWVTWALCSDAAISKYNPAYWNVSFETEEGGIISDYKDNVLRVTRGGSNWGVAYAAKPSYLGKDTTNNPTSLFVVDKSLLDWTRYTASNLGKTDQFCPAGYKESIGRKRVLRTLPTDFQLTEEWMNRLYQIAISVSAESATLLHGVCGPCLLHTFQMMAELQEYHSQGPLQSGGYFFDTAPNTNPFTSLLQRYPLLYFLLGDIPRIFSFSNQFIRTQVLAASRAMLPRYNWTLSQQFNTREDILTYVNSLINSPPGSIWLALLGRERPDGTGFGTHAVPVLRTSQGIVVMPTNARVWTLEDYRRSLTPTMDPNQVISNLEISNRVLRILVTIQLGDLHQNTFDAAISNRNCTGEGEGRRGSGGFPTSTSVNQCSTESGRCLLQ